MKEDRKRLERGGCTKDVHMRFHAIVHKNRLKGIIKSTKTRMKYAMVFQRQNKLRKRRQTCRKAVSSCQHSLGPSCLPWASWARDAGRCRENSCQLKWISHVGRTALAAMQIYRIFAVCRLTFSGESFLPPSCRSLTDWAYIAGLFGASLASLLLFTCSYTFLRWRAPRIPRSAGPGSSNRICLSTYSPRNKFQHSSLESPTLIASQK